MSSGVAQEQSATPLKMQANSASMPFHYAPQPNWGFNADANMGHAFGIFMALTCPLPAVPVEWK